MAHRFFVPPDCITPPLVTLPGDIAHQVRSVLRLRPGDEIVLLDGKGRAWRVTLAQIDKKTVQGQITEPYLIESEPELRLTLYQGTLKGQKFEWILQKGTELGVSAFVPVICQRSVVREQETIHKKFGRWQEIIREAAEQSGRGRLPHLEPPLLPAEAFQHAQSAALKVMPWEEAGETTLKTVLAGSQAQSITLFIGPEGGFTAEEAHLAQENSVHLVTLGPRILRAETASLAACAAIFYEMDEW
jgi:16S rRNA (uracil1498-N3)-methyltransferase